MTYYNTFLPSPALQNIVEYYWRSEISLAESLVQEVHTPLMQGITFNLNKLNEKMVFGSKVLEMNDHCYLFGQPAKPRLSLSNPAGIDILGVKLLPMGLYQLTGINMQYLADNIVSAEDIWGKEVRWLCEALYEAPDVAGMIQRLEDFLYQKARSGKNKDDLPPLAPVLSHIHAREIYDLNALRNLTSFSEKTLERYFKTQIGLSPKRYMRICRFNAVKAFLDKNPEIDWHDVIFSFGYYDQSHFIKEFKEFSDKTPTRYCAALGTKTLSLF